MKVLIVAGGTAGHTIPALVVAEELKKEDKNIDIIFITSRKKQDQDLILKKGYKAKHIFSGKFRRYFSFLNFIDFFAMVTGFFQSFFIILISWPDVIFAKGGYVSLPVVLAGKMLGKKIIIHESDIILGLANRISLKFADKIAVSYPLDNYKNINPEKIFFSGNPLRQMTVDKKNQGNIETILILGGSQGARKINLAVLEILDELLDRFKIIHQVGELDIEKLQRKRNSLALRRKEKYNLFSNIFNEDEFNKIFNQADIIISRAGSTVLEIAFFEKPAIIIPLSGHQEKNALFFKKNKAAVVVRNEDLTPNLLRKKILEISSNKNLTSELSRNISKFASSDAAYIITQELFKLFNKNNK